MRQVKPWVKVKPGKNHPVGRSINPIRSVRHPKVKLVLGPTRSPPSKSGNPENFVMGPGRLGNIEMMRLRATNMAATAILKADEPVFMARGFAFIRKKPAT